MFNRTDKVDWSETQILTVTIIEIRPFRNGWKCFEAPGVEPVFLNQDQAIDYARRRACFRSGEIRVVDSTGKLERTIAFTTRIENLKAARSGPRLDWRWLARHEYRASSADFPDTYVNSLSMMNVVNMRMPRNKNAMSVVPVK